MACRFDSDCPFLYSCSEQNKCIHNPVTQFSVYTVLVYVILIPLACGLVNTTGNSMGIFKVLIVMNVLRYHSNQATVVAQCLVVGSAIPNFFSIVLRKHPSIKTSLVNFNLVYVLIPCCLLGSTFGALIQEFIPQIIQDLLIIIVFSYFSLSFYKKYKIAKQKQKQLLLLNSLISQSQKEQQVNSKEDILKKYQPVQNEEVDSYQIQNAQLNLGSQKDNQMRKINEQNKKELEQIKKYQNSIHIRDIFVSFSVFLIFQFFVFLVQGKISFFKFNNCNYKYFLGLIFLSILTLCYLKVISIFLNNKFQKYKKYGLKQQIDLSKSKQFILIALGGFGAGFTQGVLGVGSGTVVMAALLSFPINPRSASATSGYQILFIGFASLVQGFINGQVDITDSLFFMGDCAILGGIVTLLIAFYLKNKNASRVATILLFVIFGLCLMSVILVFPSAITNYLDFGWDSMISIKFHC